jgi:hypothetical protein
MEISELVDVEYDSVKITTEWFQKKKTDENLTRGVSPW